MGWRGSALMFRWEVEEKESKGGRLKSRSDRSALEACTGPSTGAKDCEGGVTKGGCEEGTRGREGGVCSLRLFGLDR